MAAKPLRTFTVLPHLPERLQGLQKLAYNLWWCWNHEAIALFRRIDEEVFNRVEHSPVKLLASVGQERLEQLQQDDGFLAHTDRVVEGLEQYLAASTWFLEAYGPRAGDDRKALRQRYRTAYFSAEFGIHESIPIYSGGLGL